MGVPRFSFCILRFAPGFSPTGHKKIDFQGCGVVRISGIRRLGNFGRPIPLPSTTTTTGVLGFFSGGGAIFKLNATGIVIWRRIKSLDENNQFGAFKLSEKITSFILVNGFEILVLKPVNLVRGLVAVSYTHLRAHET